MSIFVRFLVLSVAVLAAVGARPRDARADSVGVVFVAQPVRGPVSPHDVTAVAPFVPAATPQVAGRIQIGPDRAAALWLDPLDVVVVRHDAATKLALARVVGTDAARAELVEPGVPVAAGVTYLTQPPGRGDVWIIRAAAAATVTIERPGGWVR